MANDSEKKIHVRATKDFFVNMITRDIPLRDCIFDLLDNSLDGARRAPRTKNAQFAGFKIDFSWNKSRFCIRDNCGGIQLGDAIDYAFNFGRRKDDPNDLKGGIGLYGIGMKRAIFKIGRVCKVLSHTENASFAVSINVDKWLEKDDDWDFDYEDIDRAPIHGTEIQIEALNPGIGEMFADNFFTTEFIKEVARDYSFFMDRGLKISVNDVDVPSYGYHLRQSNEIAPYVDAYKDGEVEVQVLAGLVDELPAEIPDEIKPEEVERYGWFVVCNGRVVLAADKSDRTIWGADDFNVWHPQYNGFAGFIFFRSDDQRALPWTTTKRGLDVTHPVYRRALARMREVTKLFIKYSHKRKADLDAVKEVEDKSVAVNIRNLQTPQALRLPAVTKARGPELVTIAYQRERAEVELLKRSLGSIAISNKEVGIRTFEFYKKVELGEE